MYSITFFSLFYFKFAWENCLHIVFKMNGLQIKSSKKRFYLVHYVIINFCMIVEQDCIATSIRIHHRDTAIICIITGGTATVTVSQLSILDFQLWFYSNIYHLRISVKNLFLDLATKGIISGFVFLCCFESQEATFILS